MQNERIIQSWHENANAWTHAVRTKALESRRLVTDGAILNAVLKCGGSRILDVGCGEGWLCRALIDKDKQVTGFDVSSDLIEDASKECAASLYVMSYETFVANPEHVGKDFDVVVCNFSLFADSLVEILKAARQIGKSSAHLVIQTLHPYHQGGLNYVDGWREETFHDLQGEWTPMPWYFRTMSSWMRELDSAGWHLNRLKEPIHPLTGKPASLILDAVTGIRDGQ